MVPTLVTVPHIGTGVPLVGGALSSRSGGQNLGVFDAEGDGVVGVPPADGPLPLEHAPTSSNAARMTDSRDRPALFTIAPLGVPA